MYIYIYIYMHIELCDLPILLTQEIVLYRDPVPQLVHDDALRPVVLQRTLPNLRLFDAVVQLRLKLSFKLLGRLH